MDIATLSTALADNRLSGMVGARLLSIALKTAEGQGKDLQALLASAETVSDPNLGSRLDTSA
jgi:hypothetical protein